MERFFSSIIPRIYAAPNDWANTLGGADKDVATIGSLVPLFKNIIAAVLAFTGIVLFLMLVTGGFTFLFSGGDPKQVQKAQGTITAAVIGLVVILSAYIILNFIHVFTGVDVTRFQLITN